MSERKEIKKKLRGYLPKQKGPSKGITELDVVLTTFSYFSSEKADDRNFLRKFDWNYVSSWKFGSPRSICFFLVYVSEPSSFEIDGC